MFHLWWFKMSTNLQYLVVCIYTMQSSNLNPNWNELRKQEKSSPLAPPRSIFYKTQWAWQGVKLTWLMSIFTPKKVWKFLIKIQLTKSNPKRTRGWKVPYPMPIRVNTVLQYIFQLTTFMRPIWNCKCNIMTVLTS